MQGDGFATTMPHETTPSPVSATTQQGGDVLSRWDWTERAVWTERMLTALEQGVKGGVWFRLLAKVYLVDDVSRWPIRVVRSRPRVRRAGQGRVRRAGGLRLTAKPDRPPAHLRTCSEPTLRKPAVMTPRALLVLIVPGVEFPLIGEEQP